MRAFGRQKSLLQQRVTFSDPTDGFPNIPSARPRRARSVRPHHPRSDSSRFRRHPRFSGYLSSCSWFPVSLSFPSWRVPSVFESLSSSPLISLVFAACRPDKNQIGRTGSQATLAAKVVIEKRAISLSCQADETCVRSISTFRIEELGGRW